MENLCNKCAHKDVCARWSATWGVKQCEHFMEMPKKGLWKKNWHDNNLIGHEYEECSVCGSCIISDTEKFWDCNFCPNCGADMRGDQCE